MKIATRLLLGFGAVTLLSLLLYGTFAWGTNQIRIAFVESEEALNHAEAASDGAAEINEHLQALKDIKDELLSAVGFLQQAMLQNAELILPELGDCDNRIAAFSQNGRGNDVVALIAVDQAWLARLASDYAEMKQLLAELQELWRPRHEGLVEALGDLKRTELNWSLKVANMLFVQSSLGELLYEELSETPLEEFKAGPVYAKYAAKLPELETALKNSARPNLNLYNGVDQLDDFAFDGKWNESRLYYRDNFPSNIKSILVELDRVIAGGEQNSFPAAQSQRPCERRTEPEDRQARFRPHLC